MRCPSCGCQFKPKVNADELFDEWWKVYPKRKSKARALKAWAKLTLDEKKTCIAVTPRWFILEDISDNKYIPLPASWLNDRRWEDEFDETDQSEKLGADADSWGVEHDDDDIDFIGSIGDDGEDDDA